MEQTEKKRDFKVLAEKISPDNVLIMSELLAILYYAGNFFAMYSADTKSILYPYNTKQKPN